MNISEIKGPVMMLLSSLLFAIMAVFVKLASASLPAEEIAFVRFMFGVVVCLVLAAAGVISLASGKKSLLVARGVFGGLAILLYFASIQQGTMTNAAVLNNAYPIFVTLLAPFLLKEKNGKSVFGALIVAFAGVMLLTHPDFRHIRNADILGLASALMAGVAIVVVRALRKTESAWSVFFYLSLFGAGFSGMLAIPKMVINTSPETGYMLLAALFGMLAQVTMTSAYRYCTAAVGSVLSISTALFSAVFGLLFMGESMSAMEGLGAVAIIAGSAWGAAAQGSVSGTKEPEANEAEANKTKEIG
ncbi:MAG TPA: DMT family transporter [Bacillota bacterium]|nr:DMT family transporter [Bacillota bacterium]